MHSSPHLNSAVPFLLPFPVKVRVSVIQVEVCLPGPDKSEGRDCWLHWGLLHGSLTVFWRHISLVHGSGGMCLQLMCLVLSCFAETSPSGSLCPFQSKQWSLKGGSRDACFSRGCHMRIDLFLIIKGERTPVCVSLSLLVHLIMCSFSFLTFPSPHFLFPSLLLSLSPLSPVSW